MKAPEHCQNMQEIRSVIDAIDEGIIHQLAKRGEYVKAAAKFKQNAAEVKAPDRLKSMLAKRRQWAEENDLSPDVIEQVYRILVGYFIDREMSHWKA